LELGTNGGPLVSIQVCDIPDLVKVWFNKDSIVNINSLAHMTSKYKFSTIQRERESIFVAHDKSNSAIQTNIKWVVCSKLTKQ